MNIITEIHSAVAYAFKVGKNIDCFEFIYFSKVILTLIHPCTFHYFMSICKLPVCILQGSIKVDQ